MTEADIVVVIPLYNGGKYIEEAIQSVCRQSLKPADIVIVNDGSTDDSGEIADRLATRYPVRVLHKANGGQGSARNYGVGHSMSPYIALLDQDDIWYSNHLETLYEALNASTVPPVGWAYGNMDIVTEQGRMHAHCYLDQMPHIPHPKKSVADCLQDDMHILPGASLIRREAFEAVGGFDPRLTGYEDDDLFHRIFCAGYRSVYVNKPVYQWRIHASSTSYSFKMIQSRAIYARKLVDEHPDEPRLGRFLIRDIVAPRFLDIMVRDYVSASKAGRYDEARFLLEEAHFLSQHLPRSRARRCLRIFEFLQRPAVDRLVHGNRLFASRARWLVRKARKEIRGR